MAAYSVARIDEIDEISDGRCAFRPVRHHFGLQSFGVNAWTGRDVGDRIINEHDESDDGSEELYFVASGRARFEIDGESVEASAGTFVSVASSATRTAFAEEPGTTLVAIGGVPGKPYESRGWELWAPMSQAYAEGRYREVAPHLREIVAENPQYPLLQYNLACLESLLGNEEAAIEHLGKAIEGWSNFANYAREDPDLAAVREQPGFKDIVGG